MKFLSSSATTPLVVGVWRVTSAVGKRNATDINESTGLREQAQSRPHGRISSQACRSHDVSKNVESDKYNLAER